MVTNTIRALILSSTLLAPALTGGQPAQYRPAHQPAARQVITNMGGPIRIAQAQPAQHFQPTITDATTDTTATPSVASASHAPAKQATLADTMKRAPRVIDDCVTCPPTLGPLQPASVYHLDAEGVRLGGALQKLDRGAECDRLTDGFDACLYTGESLQIKQPLLKRQVRAIDAGKAKFEYFVNWDKELTKAQNRANREIWRDGKATYDELKSHADVLPHNEKGQPYSQATVFPRLSAPGSEACEYGIKVRADACEKEVPPPVAEVPPPVVETPPPVAQTPPPVTPPPVVETPPVIAIPPPAPTTPWYARAVTGHTGLASTMEWNKPQNENCPSADCTGMFANHTLEGRDSEIEVGYKKPDFTASLSGEKVTMDVKTLDVSQGSLQRFFDSTGLDTRQLTLKARGAFLDTSVNDVAVQPYIAGSVSRGDITLRDMNTSRSDDLNAYQGSAGVKVGDFTKSYAYAGAGYSVFDQPHLLSAPSYNDGVPMSFEIRSPLAEAGGQLSLFNNRWDVFGDARYLFNSKADMVELGNRLDYKLGTNLWIDNNGKFQWGLTGDYKHQPDLKLQMPGNPTYLQHLMPDDTVRGGVIIRFGN